MKEPSLSVCSKKVEPVSELGSSSSSFMDDEVPQSLFIVVDYMYNAPYFGSIIQLETKVNNQESPKPKGYAAQTPKPRGQHRRHSRMKSSSSPHSSSSDTHTQLNEKDYVAHFSQPRGYPTNRWAFSYLASSKEDLYMLSDGDYGEGDDDFRMGGFVFNLRTKVHQPIKPHQACKCTGPVLTVGGHIYFMAHPIWYNLASEPFFECYNPDNDLWKELEPFPKSRLGASISYAYIRGIAALDDTILINIDLEEIWAYSVDRNKWYDVHVVDRLCCSFFGKAIVKENTIYALTNHDYESVLLLSLVRKEIDGEYVFTCSLCSDIHVPDMGETIYPNLRDVFMSTRHLVHLGKDKFCLIYSAWFCLILEYQPIQVTTIKLDGENSIVIDRRLHNFKIVDNRQFEVVLAFSLPEYKTPPLEKGKRILLELNPFPEDLVPEKDEIVNLPKDEEDPLVGKSNVGSKASTISAVTGHPSSHGYAEPSATTLGDGAASERSNADEEGGHQSIYVRKLPPGVTVRQVEDGLKKFGRIEKDGIKVGKDIKGKCNAFVKFESATSKKLGIEASTIVIGGCRAEILRTSRTHSSNTRKQQKPWR